MEQYVLSTALLQATRETNWDSEVYELCNIPQAIVKLKARIKSFKPWYGMAKVLSCITTYTDSRA